MKTLLTALAALTFWLSAAARAEVARAAADSFLLVEQADSQASPADAITAFGEVAHWWNSEHSYSGKSASLHLVLTPGGCFCEEWSGGAVEHARVVTVLSGRLVRLRGALGPLQGKAVDAILDFSAAGSEGGGMTRLKLTYVVNGSAASELDKLATPVDAVLKDALQRLADYLQTR